MRYCSLCGHETVVTDSRLRSDGFIHRRGECPICKVKHSSIEIPLDEYRWLSDERKKLDTFKEKVRRLCNE